MADNKVTFGLKNVHYSIISENGSTITYATPVAYKGAVSLSVDPNEAQNIFYADDVDYWHSNTDRGYTGDLVMADLDEAFETDVLGRTKDSNGAIVEKNGDIRKMFALGFEVEGDAKGRKFWYYYCSTGAPSNSHNTTGDTTNPDTYSLGLTMGARPTDGKVKAKIEPNSTNQTVFDNFLETVYEG